MDLNQFINHVYHTRLHVVIPVLNMKKLDKKDFFNKRGIYDPEKLKKQLTVIYNNYINKEKI